MAGQPLDSDVLAVLQGPSPPVAPEVVFRDAQGQATVRATRLTAPLQIDGRLDEPVYETVRSITDFIQQLPDQGALGSERTQARVLFDDDSIYISARCYDTAPPSAWVANEMRRDVIQLRQNDSFSLMLDTFYDRRNGLAFLVTPIGGFSDFAISNEGGRVNTDWNTIWDSRTDRFDGGWTVEIQIPFQSLRYRPTSTQVWEIQLRRIIRRRTEASYLTPLPISAARGNSVIAGLWHVSQAGAPTLFFSRRIGLQSGDAVPILAGGRLTGKTGAFDVGALNIQTDDERLSGAQTTNFTVLRVKRDILRRSTIGGIFTNRSVSLLGDGSNQVYGLDGRLAFFDDVTLLGYVARTRTPDRSGRDASYLGQFDYAVDRYELLISNRAWCWPSPICRRTSPPS